MERKKQILTALLLSGSVGLGAQTLFAQTAGSGSMGSDNPGQSSGSSVPGSGPAVPKTQPTIPGRQAPGVPHSTQPGTMPERAQQPDIGNQQGTAELSSADIQKAQAALRARGLNAGTSGKMDADTQEALREFQKTNDLPVTGMLDQKTAEKLGVDLKSDHGSGSIHQQGDTSTMPKSNNSRPKSGNSIP